MKPILVENQEQWERILPSLEKHKLGQWVSGEGLFKSPFDSPLYDHGGIVLSYSDKHEGFYWEPIRQCVGEPTQTVDEYLNSLPK